MSVGRMSNWSVHTAAASRAKRARTKDLPANIPAADDDEDLELSEDTANGSIMAVVENNKFEVGLAVICMADFTVEISQFCDDQAYSKTISMIARHEPHQLFFTVSMKDSVLECIVKNEFSSARIDHRPRKHWDELRGLGHLRHYAFDATALEKDVEEKFLCLAALCCLIDFFWEHEATVFVKGTLRIKYAGAVGVMLLDPASVRNLELLYGMRAGSPKESLWGILKSGCKTSAGMRLLRSSIIQPSNDLSTINVRQDCVHEMLQREDMHIDVQRILPQLADCDRVLKHFMQRPNDSSAGSRTCRAEAGIASVLHLKQLVQVAPTLGAALSSSGECPPENELLRAVERIMLSSELAEIAELIDGSIEGEAKYEKRHAQRQLQCLFAVKAELSGSLQMHRETLCDLTLQMEDVLEDCRTSFSMNQLKLNYSQRRGYHFTLPASDRSLAVDHNFIHIQQMSKKTVGCSTEKLAQINARCRDVIQKILASTTKLIGELVEEIQKKLHVLFQLSESIALLDMIASFVTYVQQSGAVFARPTIGGSSELVLKASRHPILERLGEHSSVPNDVFMTPSCNMQLVTGPNMAGKSTYLRQVALICLMAHIGCPVPAVQAQIPLLKRIFTRISTSDSLQANASSFVSEMRETSYILHNLEEDSSALVLFDELGRGTSNRDGASLAWAIIEFVQRFRRTFTIFASHYLQVANLQHLYPNIKCLRMSVAPSERRLVFEYKVRTGVATKSQYMTDFLAEVAGIPASVCERAKRMSFQVSFDSVDSSSQRSRVEASRNSIAERLVLLKRNSTLSDQDLSLYLADFQNRLRLESGPHVVLQRSPTTSPSEASEQRTDQRSRAIREICPSPAPGCETRILGTPSQAEPLIMTPPNRIIRPVVGSCTIDDHVSDELLQPSSHTPASPCAARREGTDLPGDCTEAQQSTLPLLVSDQLEVVENSQANGKNTLHSSPKLVLTSSSNEPIPVTSEVIIDDSVPKIDDLPSPNSQFKESGDVLMSATPRPIRSCDNVSRSREAGSSPDQAPLTPECASKSLPCPILIEKVLPGGGVSGGHHPRYEDMTHPMERALAENQCSARAPPSSATMCDSNASLVPHRSFEPSSPST